MSELQGSSRYFDLYDKIKAELLSLTTQLQRLTLYDDLYNDSSLMQEYLCRSYINVFRFWSRVDKECDRCSKFAEHPEPRQILTAFRFQRLDTGGCFFQHKKTGRDR